VTAGGEIVNSIPSTATNPFFDLPGPGGYPGVVSYGGIQASFGSGSVSARGWLANSPYRGRTYDYRYIAGLVRSDV